MFCLKVIIIPNLSQLKLGRKFMQDKLLLQQNLLQQARAHDWLVLWLDCDREGENIAFEVRSHPL